MQSSFQIQIDIYLVWICCHVAKTTSNSNIINLFVLSRWILCRKQKVVSVEILHNVETVFDRNHFIFGINLCKHPMYEFTFNQLHSFLFLPSFEYVSAWNAQKIQQQNTCRHVLVCVLNSEKEKMPPVEQPSAAWSKARQFLLEMCVVFVTLCLLQ